MGDSPTGDCMDDCYIELDGAAFAIEFSCLITPFDSAVGHKCKTVVGWFIRHDIDSETQLCISQ